MKTGTVLCCCMAVCGAVRADLSGSDNFNDNVRDPAKWSVFMGDSLNETNHRLEFTCDDGPEVVGVWEWVLNGAGYAQSWSISLDAHSSIDENSLSNQSISFGLLAFFNDPGVYFDVNLQVGDDAAGGNPYRIVSTEAESSTGPGLDYGIPISADNTALQLSFDAGTKDFTGWYDTGGGMTAATNFNTGSWGMTDSDLFTVVIYGLSSDLAVASGEVYGDNFAAVPEPGTSGMLLAGGTLLASLHLRKRRRMNARTG